MSRLPYSASLDGLRAVAVIAVVGYHLDINWMRGGFLGVDLFFVISGFLITRLLLGEHDDSGRIALGEFWIRRFRRLVPPLIVVVAASIVATRWWGVPQQWDAVRGDAIASLAYVANWRFVIEDVSYFDTLLGPSPLRHIWSLAVEEQWYLLWPLVMAVLTPWARRRHREGTAAGLLLGAAVLSAVWMAVLFDPNDLSRVYYGTDTRAQQLLVGAVAAWATIAAPHRFARLKSAGSTVPLTGLVIGFCAATALIGDESRWLYHGGLLGLSLGAAALVVGVSGAGTDGPLPWLASRPMVALGRRSYSLYLWHWPVIVFVGPPMGLDVPNAVLRCVQVVVALTLSEATYRWIETPTRQSTRRPVQTLVGWSVAAVATVAASTLTLATDFEALPDADVLRPESVPTVPTTVPATVPTTSASSVPTTASDADVAPTSTTSTTVPLPPVRLLLVGDSTAVTLAQANNPNLPDDWVHTGYGRLGCAITDGRPIDVGSDRPVPLYDIERCPEWQADWTSLSTQFQPTVSLVMIGAWEVFDHFVDGRRLSFPDPAWTTEVERAVREGVDAASAGGGRVALLRLPCMVISDSALLSASSRADADRIAAFNAILESVAADDEAVSTLALDEFLCPDGEPIEEIDGEPVRFDGVHLTEHGADLVWDWIVPQIGQLRETSSL